MKSLIIIPKLGPGKCMDTSLMPVGLAYISSVLKHKGYKVDVLNLNFSDRYSENQIQEVLSAQKYQFVLSGGLSINYSAVKSCVNSIRKYAPSAQIILGGGLVTSQPDVMFHALQPDYIVIGEGEVTIIELLQCLENNGVISEVNGIGYRGPKGKLVLTEPRKPIENLDSLPLPDYEGMGLDTMLENTMSSQSYLVDVFDYPRPYPLIASRSCPYQCTFCFRILGKKYRQRSIANIMDELAFAIDRYKINIVTVRDELFSYPRDRVNDFCDQIKQLSESVPWEIKWVCQMRVDAIDDNFIATIKGSGCYVLSLGLESYSATVLKSMQKKITPEQIDNALQICRRHNMTIQGNFIFGDVAETLETARETLNYWKQHHDLFGNAISLGYIQYYPGTELYKQALRRGIIQDEIDFVENHLQEPFNITETMTQQEFEQLYEDIVKAGYQYSNIQRPVAVKQVNGVPEVHVKCPYCRVISIYRNYVLPEGPYANHIRCRNCGMRFKVGLLKAKLRRMVRYTLIRTIGLKNWNRLRRFVKRVRRHFL